MSKKWETSKIIERESNIYSFSKNPLLSKNVDVHLFMPWNTDLDKNLMYKIKKHISTNGFAYIPFIDLSNNKFMKIDSNEVERIQSQLLNHRETHLVMSNFESIHVLKITSLDIGVGGIDKNELLLVNNDQLNNEKNCWIKVEDIFVLEANHGLDKEKVEEKLRDFIEEPLIKNIFHSVRKNKDQIEIKSTQNRWIDTNRSLTYDYYIRSCELHENIYQSSWNYLTRKTQHELISCDLSRYSGIFYRDFDKWNYLKQSFQSYMEALYNELNEVYIFPLINAIREYESLREAWNELEVGLVNPKTQQILIALLNEEKFQVKNIPDFIYYVRSAKSLFFSLKKKITKKIYKEEFLLVENFLSRQESLVEALICHKIIKKLESIQNIKDWIDQIDNNLDSADQSVINECNLKLSHLMSIMTSASYNDNIFFKLIEEKSSKGIVQVSFEDEVKSLLSIEIKQAS